MKMHWLDSTSRTVAFKMVSYTMCGKSVGEKAATRDHRAVTCERCMSAMDDWTEARWNELVHRCGSNCTPGHCVITGGGTADLAAASPDRSGGRRSKREEATHG